MAPDLSPYTSLPNLYMTGQDVVALGLAGSVLSGYMTACAMEGYGDVPNLLLGREIMDDFPPDPTTRDQLPAAEGARKERGLRSLDPTRQEAKARPLAEEFRTAFQSPQRRAKEKRLREARRRREREEAAALALEETS